MYKSILFHVIGTKICFEKNNSILQSSLVHMKHGDQGFSDPNRCVCGEFGECWLQSGFSDYLMWHNSIKESRENPLWFRQSPLLDSIGTTNKYIACWKVIKRINKTSECLFGRWYISSSVQDLILRHQMVSSIITWTAVLHNWTFFWGGNFKKKKIRYKTIRFGFLMRLLRFHEMTLGPNVVVSCA